MDGNAGSRADRACDAAAPRIGTLSTAEVPPLAAVLARAFRDNPLNVAVIQSDDPVFRIRCNFHGMRALLPVARACGQVLAAWLEGRLAGALVAANPYGYPLPAPPLAARFRCFWGQGWRVARRWARVFESLDALHPLEPLGYLGTLGVDPSLQGRDAASARRCSGAGWAGSTVRRRGRTSRRIAARTSPSTSDPAFACSVRRRCWGRRSGGCAGPPRSRDARPAPY
jgi:hypothetical protein